MGDEGKHCRVHFRVRSLTRYGESIGIGGSCSELGNFSSNKVVQLVTTPETYPVWRTLKPVVIPRDEVLQYSYCLIEAGKVKLFEKREKRLLFPKDFEVEAADECPVESLIETPVEDLEMSLTAKLRKRAESRGEEHEELTHFKRIILICYHLPIEITRTKDPSAPFSITWAESLIAKSVKHSITASMEVRWIGTMPYVGPTTPAEDEYLRTALASMNCTPIFFDDGIVQAAYFGYCKKVLWPLFHNVDQVDHIHAAWNFPTAATNQSPFMLSSLNSSTVSSNTIITWEQDPKYWPAYQAMNEAFLPVLESMVQSGDVLWIHDYHLTLLPSLIREHLTTSSVWIVYFSHIPFPTSQVRYEVNMKLRLFIWCPDIPIITPSNQNFTVNDCRRSGRFPFV
jgi:trehalose 6-phosphate synthase/phosphatase